MKNPKLLAAVAVLIVLGVGIPYGIKHYRLSQMTETDLFSMGQVVANRGDCGKALDYYGMLLKKDPRHTVAMDFMASCQIRLDDNKGAIATLERRNGLEPQPKPLSLLADLYDKVGDKDRATLTRAKVQTMINDRAIQEKAAAEASAAQHAKMSHAPAGKPTEPKHQTN